MKPGDDSLFVAESGNTSFMTAPEATSDTPATPEPKPAVTSWRDSFAVYLQPRVLIVLLLGFSSGLP
ncbi:hypothetical protein, partial [Escherichia coli]|uniref:hypothetical protein n=1 Tax=Escherichia coli TaxID=562 RepID=UPI001961467E